MRTLVIVAALSIAAATAGLEAAAAAHAQRQPPSPPGPLDAAAPRMPRDVGEGEQLVLVVGGVFATRAEAESAAQPFGDLQGYYVVPEAQFAGLHAQLPAVLRAEGGRAFALVSAFRTQQGAQEFARLAQDSGRPALITARVTSLGGDYAGLGQEAAPNGVGPLRHAIRASLPELSPRDAIR
jgi:hypothetical protein